MIAAIAVNLATQFTIVVGSRVEGISISASRYLATEHKVIFL